MYRLSQIHTEQLVGWPTQVITGERVCLRRTVRRITGLYVLAELKHAADHAVAVVVPVCDKFHN